MSTYLFKPSMMVHPSFVRHLTSNLTIVKKVKGTAHGDIDVKPQFNDMIIPTELNALNLVSNPNNLVYRNMKIADVDTSPSSFPFNYNYIKVLNYWYEHQSVLEEIYLYTTENDNNKLDDSINPSYIYYVLKAKYNDENTYVLCERNMIKLEMN